MNCKSSRDSHKNVFPNGNRVVCQNKTVRANWKTAFCDMRSYLLRNIWSFLNRFGPAVGTIVQLAPAV